MQLHPPQLLATVVALRALFPCAATAQSDLELDHFTYRVEEFDAPSIEQGSSEYVIYLPKSWNPPVAVPKSDETKTDEPPAEEPTEDDKATKEAKRYPLAIWLHGMRETHRRFHDNEGPETLDRLRGEGKIDDMIFVAVSANRRPVYLNGLASGDYVDFVVKDLLAHLEKQYPVATEAKHRAIMGVSIGGMGAMTMALTTDKFGTVAAHSACVLPAKYQDIPGRMGRRIGGMAERLGIGAIVEDQAEWDKVSTLSLVRDADKAQLDGLNIYFDAGDADRYGFGPANQSLHETFDSREIAHVFELVANGGHSWGSGSIQRQLPKSLTFVGASFRGERPAATKTDAATKEAVEADAEPAGKK